MQRGLLLDVVVSKIPSIFQLHHSKYQPLLIWWNTLLILDLSLDIVNGVSTLHLQGNGLPGQGLLVNLHPTTKTQHQV